MKPSYSLTELVLLIAGASSLEELERIRQVLDSEKDSYSYAELKVLAGLITQALERI